MDNRIVDLHVHSTESDGTFTPTEVIAEAKKAGLSAIALTDHDTREFDTLKSKKVPQSLEIGLFFCQIFIFII